MKKSLLFSFVCLFSVACTPSAPSTELPPTLEVATLPEATSGVTATPNTPRLQPTEIIPTATPLVSEPEEPTAVPTTMPTTVPETAVETETETAAAGGEVISGRTEEGAFFLGAPDAPITHIDYSDFL